MEVNSEVLVCIGKDLMLMLAGVSKQSMDVVIHALYDMTREPVEKIRSPDFGSHWSYKTLQFLDTPIKLKVKAKFKSFDRNVKRGNIYCTFEMPTGKATIYKEHDVLEAALTGRSLV